MKDILQKIENKEAVIGVIGLGYVGLPLCREFVRGGAKVLGFDVDPKKIEAIDAKKTYIEHIPDETIAEMVESGLFSATTNLDRLSEPDAILIAVPTPLNKMREPDLSFVENSCREISIRLRKGQLVVLESTTYPGTTREIIKPILEESSGLIADNNDFYLAYSPEREDPGRKDFTTKTIPKVVGGYNETSLQVATAVYKLAIDTPVSVSSCDAAEAAKILENTYRSVNIALVNELKMLFDRMDIDVWEVIDAAKTKPFGFTAFYPGPGLGGHCIPIDPFYLSWKAKEYGVPTRFIELAGEINTAMPEWVVNKVMHALNDKGKAVKGSKILLLGMAYKPNVDDDRESPSYKLMELLNKFGAEVEYHDPHVPMIRHKREYPQYYGQESVELTKENLQQFDCVLISTDHQAVDYAFVCQHADLVVDTRNCCEDAVVKA
ncbi:nucleotide sugar dehydrogenase [Desulfosediminicola ganghwensis]|uniref:nucleotide sugar dehydrogenase n=1 Tax=Desulfosediminicola ganghwensis TaxID=2569540 RepID=UPI0010AC8EAA|nr:nucleotide sugar dehydrogenase [Desulfosediminicola ganghwensis]